MANPGQIVYVAVGYGGFLGIGQQITLVPWSMFTIDEPARTFTMSADAQTFKQAPPVDVSNLPKASNNTWDSAIRSFWAAHQGGASSGGTGPAASTTPAATAIR